MKTGSLFAVFPLAFVLGAFAVQAGAQKTYKWVDEKGVVNYGTVPPSTDKAGKVNTAPALTTRNSGPCTGRNCYDSASNDAARAQASQEQQERYQREQKAQQEQMAEAQQQRRNQLIAECERGRGTDCRSDATLRYMENIQRPRGRRY
jgi:hypothetical protein